MTHPIFVESGVLVPAEAIEMRAVRSSGPGGQNVNKVSSKVELRVDLTLIRGMDPEGRERLLHILGKRLDGSGRLMVTSQRSRDQYRNLEDAQRKIHDWILRALKPPKIRVLTNPKPSSDLRRLEGKHRRAEHKRNRRAVSSFAED